PASVRLASPSVLLPLRAYVAALIPYTTLFRSRHVGNGHEQAPATALSRLTVHRIIEIAGIFAVDSHQRQIPQVATRLLIFFLHRSEEHTSELQSRENIVCRLLLEKKKR